MRLMFCVQRPLIFLGMRHAVRDPSESTNGIFEKNIECYVQILDIRLLNKKICLLPASHLHLAG